MIEIAQTARCCSVLILAKGYKRGLIGELDGSGWDLQLAFKELVRYLEVERQALRDLAQSVGGKLKLLLNRSATTPRQTPKNPSRLPTIANELVPHEKPIFWREVLI